MSFTITNVDIRGKAFEQVLGEVLLDNNTVAKKLVTIADKVKANTIFTDYAHAVTLQTYTSGTPSASGSSTVKSFIVTPQKYMAYDEFNMEDLRYGRFNRDMAAGAWNMASNEFESTVLNGISPYISKAAEKIFWNGATSATKTAVAALTAGTGQAAVGAAEKTYVAAATPSLFDGVVTQMIYNNGGLGARVKVAGTTIDSSNIFTEYGKLYTGTSTYVPEVLHDTTQTNYIYAPYSHLAFIRQFNAANTYKSDVFLDKGDKIYFQGIEVVFVPLPENCMILGSKNHIVWATDLTSDENYLNIDKKDKISDTMFYKAVFTLTAHIRNQKFNTLYLG